MKIAFLTITAAGFDSADLVELLSSNSDLNDMVVLAKGDIRTFDTDLAPLTSEVILHEPTTSNGLRHNLRLVGNWEASAGRWLTADELNVIRQFGVCTEMDIAYSGEPPKCISLKEAVQAEISDYGFAVAPADDFKFDATLVDEDTIEFGTEKRWLRIRMPAWFNLPAV